MSAEPGVVDASALAALLFDEPEAAATAAILEDLILTAPTLLPYEIASVTLKKLHRRPQQAQAILLSADLFNHLAIDLVETPHAELASLALRTDLSVYDAAYLWLATELVAPLITLDRDMADRARRLGMRVLNPA